MKFKLVFIITLTAFIFQRNECKSQTIYETQFKDEIGNSYLGFMVYYSESNCYMRVAFTHSEIYHVVNIDYNAKTGIEDGVNYLMLSGSNANFITGNLYNFYIPENFIWLWNNNESTEKPFYTTDPIFTVDNIKTVEYFKEIEIKNLSIDYLKQFYSTNEADFLNFSKVLTTTSELKPDYTTINKPTIHLIIAANTRIGDIGKSCDIDKRNVVSEFEGIADALNINIKQYIVDDTQFSKNILTNTLNSIQAQKNDIVVFLYTGHGFRWNDQKDSYPQLDLRYNTYQELSTDNSIGLSDVYNLLSNKAARLTLILGDCCNSNSGRNQISNSNYFATRSNQNYDKQKLFDLLIKSKGILISSAASPGEYSWSNGVNGGFFTDSFLQSFREEISLLNKAKPNWEKIIDNTIVKAQYKTTKENCQTCKTQNGIKFLKVEPEK